MQFVLHKLAQRGAQARPHPGALSASSRLQAPVRIGEVEHVGLALPLALVALATCLPIVGLNISQAAARATGCLGAERCPLRRVVGRGRGSSGRSIPRCLEPLRKRCTLLQRRSAEAPQARHARHARDVARRLDVRGPAAERLPDAVIGAGCVEVDAPGFHLRGGLSPRGLPPAYPANGTSALRFPCSISRAAKNRATPSSAAHSAITMASATL